MVQDGHFLKPKAFSGADRLRRHPQDHEERSSSASLLVLQVSGTKENSVSIAILPTE